MTRTHYALYTLGIVALLSAFFVGIALAASTSLTVALSGGQEVPPVNSTTTATFTIAFDNGGHNMTYDLNANGKGITTAHLHCASAGENGPIVVTLFHSSALGTNVSGDLSSGSIKDNDIENAACKDTIGKRIRDTKDLSKAIEKGDIYVNVHTLQFPSGAARAQLDLGDNDDGHKGGGDDDKDGDGHDNGGGNRQNLFRQLMNQIRNIIGGILMI